MEKKQVDNDFYVLYSPDTLKYVTDKMCELLDKKTKEYYKIFKVDKFRKLQINLFDDKEKFRNFIYELRGENTSLPSYATGTFDNGMVNSYVEKNLLVDSPKYNSVIYTPIHELFHIMYMEIILKNNLSNRYVWFDEGMAQYFSGEKDNLKNKEEFINFFNKVKENTKVFPNLSRLEHGNDFCNENYNGYNLSYIAVRYLKENLNDKEFYDLMSNFKEIEKHGIDIVKKSFEYFE